MAEDNYVAHSRPWSKFYYSTGSEGRIDKPLHNNLLP